MIINKYKMFLWFMIMKWELLMGGGSYEYQLLLNTIVLIGESI